MADDHAFTAFYNRNVQLVARILRQVLGAGPDVGDAVHALFLRLYLRRALIPQLENETAWVSKVAHRFAIEYSKGRRRRLDRERPIDIDPPAPLLDAEEALDARRRLAKVEEAMLALSPRDQAIWRLWSDEKDAVEVGRLLHMPAASVRRRLSLVRGLLRRLFQPRPARLP